MECEQRPRKTWSGVGSCSFTFFSFLFLFFFFFFFFGHPLTLIKPSQPHKHGKLGELFCLKWPCSQGLPYNFSQLCCKDEYSHSCSESQNRAPGIKRKSNLIWSIRFRALGFKEKETFLLRKRNLSVIVLDILLNYIILSQLIQILK
jgi:hypothetical protein